MALVGRVDGCKAGWLLLVLDTTRSRGVEPRILPDAASLFARLAELQVMTIDIPVGLTDGPPRECDVAARRMLGPRRSSVFPAPIRPILDAGNYLEACRLSQEACGKKLSKQAFTILPRIRDVDVQMRRIPGVQQRVREVHPEVCFYFWAGRAMQHPKHRGPGLAELLVLVEQRFPGNVGAVRRAFSRGAVGDDDILDAFEAVWTAERVIAEDSRTVPDQPPADRYGLMMEMVA